VVAGYVVSKQALITRMARAEVDKAEAARLKQASLGSNVGSNICPEYPNGLNRLNPQLDRFEGSQTPGLEEFRDKYATTR
jgi:hypothetical protein